MGRVLLIDGSVRPSGLPTVYPAGAWVPAWGGGTRPNPGQATYYGADLDSGALRFAQRPHSKYGATHFALRDVGEIGHPLSEIARQGILLERTKTQVLTAGNWDFTSWTATNASVTGSKPDLAGGSTAYQVVSSSAGGNVSLNKTGLSNTNANTYVFSVWIRRSSGTGTCRLNWIPGVGSTSSRNHVITTKWQRVWVSSPNENTTAADLQILPDISAAATVFVWGPQLENTGSGAGKSGRGRSSLMAGGSAARPASFLSGPFAWPAPPWTFRCRMRPFWGGSTDGQAHAIFSAYRTAGTDDVLLYKQSSDTLTVLVRNRDSTNKFATVSAAGAHEDPLDFVASLSRDGALSAYVNGTVFTSLTAAPGALTALQPTSLSLGDNSDASTGGMDGVLERLEVWDEAVHPREFV